MRKLISTAFMSLLVAASAAAGDKCTDRPECWPEGSSMHTGLLLVQRQRAVEKNLAHSHAQLLALVSSTRSADGSFGTDQRLLDALAAQQAAWLKYRSEECELVGALTGAGGTWASTHAGRCEVNHAEQRHRRVRSAIRCVERLPVETRVFAQNNCLQQLAPLTNR